MLKWAVSNQRENNTEQRTFEPTHRSTAMKDSTNSELFTVISTRKQRKRSMTDYIKPNETHNRRRIKKSADVESEREDQMEISINDTIPSSDMSDQALEKLIDAILESSSKPKAKPRRFTKNKTRTNATKKLFKSSYQQKSEEDIGDENKENSFEIRPFRRRIIETKEIKASSNITFKRQKVIRIKKENNENFKRNLML